MSTKTFIVPFAILLMLNACKKPASTTYDTLGTYDTAGKPSYLLSKDVVSASLVSFLDSVLPAGENIMTSHPELLTTSADIKITQQSDVYMTFVSEGAGITNSIAFYTYPTNDPPTQTKDVKTITYIFPNSGLNTPLQAGDKVKIGRFDAGTSVGFILLQGSWDPTTKTLDSNVPRFWTTDALNPEADPNLKKHAILLSYPSEGKSLIGFEDFDRTKPQCDDDFNDVVVYCTVTP